MRHTSHLGPRKVCALCFTGQHAACLMSVFTYCECLHYRISRRRSIR